MKTALGYLKAIGKWGAISVIIGIVCGGVGTAFYMALKFVTGLRVENPWLLFLLPIAGIVIVFCYRGWGVQEDPGTNLVISSIRSSDRVPLKMAPLIFLGTVLTHLCGGSAGREGAALQIGGSVGAWIGGVLRFEEKDVKTVTMCGMAAVFSALFGTPVTAAIFSMEVISVGVMYYSTFFPCVVSAIIAAGMARYFGAAPVAFTFLKIPSISVLFYMKVLILAGLCGLLSIFFIKAMHVSGKLYRRYLKNQYIRAAVGGAIVLAITLLAGTRDYNGAGTDVIASAISGEAVPWAFLLKILLTALTLGAGFKGGEIVPAFFVGSTFGCFAGGIMGLDSGFSAAVGLVALFCGVVNCPITALVLSVELFGGCSIVIFASVCATSYVLSGYYGLYSSQNIVYSKLKTEYINRNAK